MKVCDDSETGAMAVVAPSAGGGAATASVRVFAINLRRSTERWARLEPQLRKLGLPWERFEAVDGQTAALTAPLGGYDPGLNRRQFHRPLSKGEMACYESHLGALRRFLATRAEYALVLEDDVLLLPELGDAVAAALRSAEPWDVVKLGSVSPKAVRRERRLGRFRWRQYWKAPISGFAHLVSRHGAERVLTARRRYGRPFDVDLQYWWEAGLRIRGIEPYPVIPWDKSVSDIRRGGGRPPRHAWYSSIVARLRFQILNWKHSRRPEVDC